MMARVVKIDNAWKKRFEREEKKRAVKTRDKRVYFLIVCEGERTEPEYFKALQKELPVGTIKLEIDGTGLNTIGLVNYAIKQRDNAGRKYDRVWAVFDRDSFPENNFNGAIIKATANDINCAWTNEAFELWFLLHFQYVITGMKRDAYQAYLEREVIKRSGNTNYKYLKKDPNTFYILQTHGNQKQAIKRAIKLNQSYTGKKHATHNPCTRVHKLIEELFNPKEILKELEKNKR